MGKLVLTRSLYPSGDPFFSQAGLQKAEKRCAWFAPQGKNHYFEPASAKAGSSS
jgi:hypothetical protein